MIDIVKKTLNKDSKLYKLLSNTLHNLQSINCLTIKRIEFEIGGLFRTLGLGKEYDSLRRFKGIYNNTPRRCFIVATGPSLTLEDLELLRDNNEITISVNGVFQLYSKTDWRPTYYGLIDEFVYERFKNNGINFDFKHIASEQAFIDKSLCKVLHENHEDLSNVSFVPVYRFNHYVNYESRRFGFSLNLLRGHFSTWTVTNFAINLAAFMGIKEIYLLGVDCSYSGKKQYVNGVVDPKLMSQDAAYKTQQKMIDSYKYISKQLTKRNIKVYNATRGGELEVFERIDFDSLFNNL